METEEHASRGTARASATDRAGRLGRRVGIAVYLIGLVYMVSVGFATFIYGIFVDSARADATDAPCESIRHELATELRARAAGHVAGDTADTPRFFRTFDERIEAVRDRCDDPETKRLERMRFRVEITLHRFDRENAAAFTRLGAEPSSPSHEEPSR